jgi:glycosyltransferase involved in cell wall biosynthesis
LFISSVSPWLHIRALQSPILGKKKNQVILNGIDTSIFNFINNSSIYNELGIHRADTIVFHVTPNFNDDTNNLKGGKYVIELAKRLPHIKFIVAGPSYGKVPSIPSNIIRLGAVTDPHKLAQLYSIAQITVLTSKKETFSMVCAESLSCGTPIVGFLAGAPEQISLSEYSTFVEYGQIDRLQSAVEKFLSQSFDKNAISQKAREKYSREVMAKSYINLYQNMLIS